ncbi:GHKL domain-containing protein, partial [Christensenellaceae bacterium OttesenSCG-928-K19]|nr:GHKL domain-containing protein [Christensenellaceae bacterium OttesenSCG-928-K19]
LAYELRIFLITVAMFLACVFCLVMFLIQVYRRKSSLPMLCLALIALFWSYSAAGGSSLTWDIFPTDVFTYTGMLVTEFKYLPIFFFLCYSLVRQRKGMILITIIYAAYNIMPMFLPEQAYYAYYEHVVFTHQPLFLIAAFLMICLEYRKAKYALVLKIGFAICAAIYGVYLANRFAYGPYAEQLAAIEPVIDMMETLLYVAILLGVIIAMAYRIIKDIVSVNVQLRLMETRQENTIKSYQTLMDYTKQVATLRHDMKSHLAALGHILQQGDQGRAVAYIRELNEQQEDVSDITLTENLLVNTILNKVLHVCEELGIAADMKDIRLPEKLPFADNDIVAVLTNLLDNAVEAAGKAVAAEKSIRLEMHIKSNHLYIGMQNGLAQAGQSPPESKGPMHGHGLDIIRKIAGKYHGHTQFEIKNNQFYSTVVLYSGDRINE